MQVSVSLLQDSYIPIKSLIPGIRIDGIKVRQGDTILLNNQLSASENGVYIINGSKASKKNHSGLIIYTILNGIKYKNTTWQANINAQSSSSILQSFGGIVNNAVASSSISGVNGLVVAPGKNVTFNNTMTFNSADGDLITIPGSGAVSLVDTTSSQSLSNKTILNASITGSAIDNSTSGSITVNAASFTISDLTKQARFDCSDISNFALRTFTFPNTSGTFVTTNAEQNLNSKTLTDVIINNYTPDKNITVSTSDFVLCDTTDTTKTVKFNCSLIPTNESRTFMLPNIINGTIVVSNEDVGVEDLLFSNINIYNKTNGNIHTSDLNFFIYDISNINARAKFDCSAISSNTLRTFTFPNLDGTLVTTNATQELFSKTLTSCIINNMYGGYVDTTANTFVLYSNDLQKRARFDCSALSPNILRTFTFPDVDDTLVTINAYQDLHNKTLSSCTINNNIDGHIDTLAYTFVLHDTDLSKTASFDCSAISPDTLRTFTFPDIDGTLIISQGQQDLYNKTFYNCSLIDCTIQTISYNNISIDVTSGGSISTNDSNFTIVSDQFIDRIARFNCSVLNNTGVSIFKLPYTVDLLDTIVTENSVQTLNFKTLNGVYINNVSYPDATITTIDTNFTLYYNTLTSAVFDCAQINANTISIYTLPALNAASDTIVTLNANQTLTNKKLGNDLLPDTTNVVNLGSSDFAYNNIYVNNVVTTSDERAKKNIDPVDTFKALEFVNALKPVEFEYKEADGVHLGFIAQDIQKVIDKISLYNIIIDDNDAEHLAVRYMEFIPALVACIQQLSARIVKLESKSKDD